MRKTVSSEDIVTTKKKLIENECSHCNLCVFDGFVRSKNLLDHKLKIVLLFVFFLKQLNAYPIMCRTIYYDTPSQQRDEEFFQPWPMQPMDNGWQPRESPPYYMDTNRPASQDSSPFYVEPLRSRMPVRPCQPQQPIINRMPASQVASSQPSTMSSAESSKIETIMSKVIELLQKIIRKLYPEEEKSVTKVGTVNHTATP